MSEHSDKTKNRKEERNEDNNSQWKKKNRIKSYTSISVDISAQPSSVHSNKKNTDYPLDLPQPLALQTAERRSQPKYLHYFFFWFLLAIIFLIFSSLRFFVSSWLVSDYSESSYKIILQISYLLIQENCWEPSKINQWKSKSEKNTTGLVTQSSQINRRA